jgi:hypothetical protein
MLQHLLEQVRVAFHHDPLARQIEREAVAVGLGRGRRGVDALADELAQLQRHRLGLQGAWGEVGQPEQVGEHA